MTIDPSEFRDMAEMMEECGCAHALSLAIMLSAMSPFFGADLVKEVNARRMNWGEVILALYFAAEAAGK